MKETVVEITREMRGRAKGADPIPPVLLRGYAMRIENAYREAVWQIKGLREIVERITQHESGVVVSDGVAGA